MQLVFWAMSTVISSNQRVYPSSTVESTSGLTISIPALLGDKHGSVPCGWGKRTAVISIPRIQNCFPGVSWYNRDLIKWGWGWMGFLHGGGIQFLQVHRVSARAVLFWYVRHPWAPGSWGSDWYRFYYALCDVSVCVWFHPLQIVRDWYWWVECCLRCTRDEGNV